jgi:hypothetical protein
MEDSLASSIEHGNSGLSNIIEYIPEGFQRSRRWFVKADEFAFQDNELPC